MKRFRIFLAVAVIVLVMAGFSFESLHTALGNHESVTQPKPTTLQQLLTTCIFSPANTTNLAWDGSKIVSVNGTSFDTMEATDHVYGGGTPSEIGLTVPLILDGVTFASPSPKSFQNVTIFLGMLYMSVTFTDGKEQKLAALLFPPSYKNDGSPRSCAEIVSYGTERAGFAFIWTPTNKPLEYPALGYSGTAGIFQGRLFLIVETK